MPEAFAISVPKSRNFVTIHNRPMLEQSGLGKLEHEMIATMVSTVVSSINHYYLCLVVDGAQALRRSGAGPS